ncbi:hypothetical protein [Exiguobacterium sp. UBA5002]|uniref:hypothetical protein n=1 Tax=Exiguobacterium sp. UBA5002 TaxID=1946497 RepID=UPI0025BF0E60|nr:hypothetical protein [Exiguobacterium sp. UBA5002]
MDAIEIITLSKIQLEHLLEESADRAIRKLSDIQPQWMQRQAAAHHLGIDAATLDKYTIRDGIPYHTPQNSKLKLYNKVDLDAWGRGEVWK